MKLPWRTSVSKPSSNTKSPIFIDDMGTSKVEKLLSKKRDIEKEIDKIQSACNHKDKVIQLVQRDERYSSFEVRWVCNDCSQKLGYPTEWERERFYK
tara:strand:+ start:173 stop:463 length:291 start_codon:yes stop_codon:yes gene_type:complete